MCGNIDNGMEAGKKGPDGTAEVTIARAAFTASITVAEKAGSGTVGEDNEGSKDVVAEASNVLANE